MHQHYCILIMSSSTVLLGAKQRKGRPADGVWMPWGSRHDCLHSECIVQSNRHCPPIPLMCRRAAGGIFRNNLISNDSALTPCIITSATVTLGPAHFSPTDTNDPWLELFHSGNLVSSIWHNEIKSGQADLEYVHYTTITQRSGTLTTQMI